MNRYGKEVPNTVELYYYNYCPHLLSVYNQRHVTSTYSPTHIVSRALAFTLRQELGNRSWRHNTRKWLIENSPEDLVEQLIRMIDSTIDIIQHIRKKHEIVNVNMDMLNTNNPDLPYKSHVDLMYGRKWGPCYTVILPDFIDNTSSGQMDKEDIAFHTITMGAALAEYEKTINMMKYVEIIVPSMTEDPAKKYLIEITNKMTKYLDFCNESMYNLTRKYYIEEEYTTHWSDKCIRCSQNGLCTSARRAREKYGGIIQEL